MLNILLSILKSVGSKLASEAGKRVLIGAGSSAGAAIIVNEVNKRKKKKSEKHHFEEGYKTGEKDTKQKCADILNRIRARDEYLLLVMKIGVYLANIDGTTSPQKMEALDKYIGKIFDAVVTPNKIRELKNQIKRSKLNEDEVFSAMRSFIAENKDLENEIKGNVKEFILSILHADENETSYEREFLKKWDRNFK